VHGAEVPRRRGGQRMDAVELRDVGRYREHVGARGAQVGGGGLDRRGVEVGEHQTRPARRKGAGHGHANPAGPAVMTATRSRNGSISSSSRGAPSSTP